MAAPARPRANDAIKSRTRRLLPAGIQCWRTAGMRGAALRLAGCSREGFGSPDYVSAIDRHVIRRGGTGGVLSDCSALIRRSARSRTLYDCRALESGQDRSRRATERGSLSRLNDATRPSFPNPWYIGASHVLATWVRGAGDDSMGYSFSIGKRDTAVTRRDARHISPSPCHCLAVNPISRKLRRLAGNGT